MLSKTKEDLSPTLWVENDYDTGSSSTVTVYEWTYPGTVYKWRIVIDDIYVTWNAGFLTIKDGGTILSRTTYTASGWHQTLDITATANTSSSFKIQLDVNNNYGTSHIYLVWCKVYAITKDIEPPYYYMAPYWLNVKPYKVEEIGKQTECFLYGIDVNGEYKGGIMIDKDTTATTGSITLGNAVGFIKVNFNGEIIKIPYYNN